MCKESWSEGRRMGEYLLDVVYEQNARVAYIKCGLWRCYDAGDEMM